MGSIEPKHQPFVQVVIIGAGLAGLDMGIGLKRKYNFHDFLIFERNTGHGGTWFDNDCKLT